MLGLLDSTVKAGAVLDAELSNEPEQTDAHVRTIRREICLMRKYFAPVLLLLVNTFTLSAADLTGTWKGTLTPENRDPGPALVILKHTGETVTGTAGPDESERHDIANGKVMGDRITFEVPREQGTMRFVLTLEGDSLNGQVTRDRDGQQQTAKLNLKREK
jgi:hypothetical protein